VSQVQSKSAPEASDRTIVDFLRQRSGASIGELIAFTGVTATAVRQRLTRLMRQGWVERVAQSAGRGRPSHRYSLTEAGRRSGGNNYNALAQVLWEEIRGVPDASVRQGLLKRISERLSDVYREEVAGGTLRERMQSLAAVMTRQEVRFEVADSTKLPVLTAVACPFPDLAERDRSVCAMEKMMLSEVLGENLKLSACRLDGSSCCTFEVSGGAAAPSVGVG
jgi:predicted ArsR family transcriptional regulator